MDKTLGLAIVAAGVNFVCLLVVTGIALKNLNEACQANCKLMDEELANSRKDFKIKGLEKELRDLEAMKGIEEEFSYLKAMKEIEL